MRLKDLAEKLGVSPATVSLAIHNRPGVSEATRERIFKELRENGMERLIPKENARKLRHLQLVLYKNGKEILTDSPFFLKLIEGIDIQAKQDNFGLMVSYFTAGEGVEDQLEKLRESKCDGIILLATEMTSDEVLPFKELGIPLVALDQNLEEIGVSSVAINNEISTRKAVEYLISLGHERIGYLRSENQIQNFTERYEGYCRAMDEAGLYHPDDGQISSPPSVEGSYLAMKKQLKRIGLTCTAFIADNDNILCGAMKALREYNIAIPERVSLIGFDDLPMTSLCEPPLDTIRVPKQQMGAIAVSLMTAMLNAPFALPVKISVGTEFVKRKSSALPPIFNLL